MTGTRLSCKASNVNADVLTTQGTTALMAIVMNSRVCAPEKLVNTKPCNCPHQKTNWPGINTELTWNWIPTDAVWHLEKPHCYVQKCKWSVIVLPKHNLGLSHIIIVVTNSSVVSILIYMSANTKYFNKPCFKGWFFTHGFYQIPQSFSDSNHI